MAAHGGEGPRRPELSYVLIWRVLGALLAAGALIWLGFAGPGPSDRRAQALCPTAPAGALVREGDADAWRLVAPAVALLKRDRFGPAFAVFERAASEMGTDPVALMTDSLEHLGPRAQRDGARWLGAWIRRNAADRAESACTAALFVSEYDSPARAAALMERVHAQHPEDFLPAATLATVLIHRVGVEPLPPEESDRLLARAEGLIADAHRHALSPEDRRDAQLLEVDRLAFLNRSAEALDLYERISDTGVTMRDVAEREWEAAILSLKLGQGQAAADHLDQTLEFTRRLEAEDSERLTPPAALALVCRHVLLRQPLRQAEVDELEASVQRLQERGLEASAVSAPLLGLPRLALRIDRGDPAQVREAIAHLEALERQYGPEGPPVACLTWLTHYRPVTVALTHALRSEAWRRLGDEAAAASHDRLFEQAFPRAAAVID